MVFIYTGIRIGEATAVQWDDLDFETGVLSIDKTLYYKNQSDYRFTEPKTKASIRHIVPDTCFGSTKNMEERPAKSC